MNSSSVSIGEQLEQLAQLQRQLQAQTQRAEREAELRERAEERTQRAEEKISRTTFNDFLQACHTHLSKPLRIRPSAVHVSGSAAVTSRRGRLCPQRLRKWTFFENDQQRTFREVSAIYHPKSEPAPKPFPPQIFIDGLSEAVAKRQVTSEHDLRIHECTNVEDMVVRILDDIVDRDEGTWDLRKGLVFQNHVNDLGDSAQEVQDRLTVYSEADTMPKPKNADQICVVRRRPGANTVAFLIEYKSPMKLPAEILRRGLRDMDLSEIINNPVYSTDKEKRDAENAEGVVAAILSQLYSYMLEAGIEYGYLSTGEAYVFLRIPDTRPADVEFHLAEPNLDVDGNYDEDGAIAFSAVGQVMCFCLRAANNSQRRSQQWRRDAKAECLTWEIDENKVLEQMTPVQCRPEPSPSSYNPTPSRKLRSDEGLDFKTRLRSSRKDKSRESCAPDSVRRGSDPEESPDESNDDPPSPLAKKRPAAFQNMDKTIFAQNKNSNSGDKRQHQPYCSHKCLLGLRGRGALDPECPNFPLHPSSDDLRHTINSYTFRTLLRDQLDRDMDKDCIPLDIQGARGALFKLTLTSYGYTIVGKGTVRAFVPDLYHEGRIYKRLRQHQGRVVPVCLGNVDCIQPYYYDFGVRIIHFLLLSWGGEALNWQKYCEYIMEIGDLEDAVRALGVKHEDERCLNVLWDERSKQLMLIDFERAIMTEREEKKTQGKAKSVKLESSVRAVPKTTESLAEEEPEKADLPVQGETDKVDWPVEGEPTKTKSSIETQNKRKRLPLEEESPNRVKKGKCGAIKQVDWVR